MPVRLLHTADWHIGKPFGRFPDERASVLRRARVTAIDRLAAIARAGAATAVIVAGDVFDGPGLPDRDLMELMARLSAHRELDWHIIPGNHDPATQGGVWDRVARLGLPANVEVHLVPQPVEIAPGVHLLPSPLTAKAVTADPTAWMSAATTPDGAIRIGLAHGSTQGFGSAQQASVNISPTRARDAGLSYLALGDWHGTREVATATWYAGTPEPDSYQDNDPGNALLVSIDGPGAPARIEPHRTAEMTWLTRRLAVDDAGSIDRLLSEIDRVGEAASRLLLDLTLDGEVTLAQDTLLRERIARELDPRLFHLSTAFDGLRLAPATDDLSSLDDPILRQIAVELGATAAGTTPDAAIAAHALRRLYQTARAEGSAA